MTNFQWGPAGTTLSAKNEEDKNEIHFYGGFKSEKLGKIADWIGLENKARYRNHDVSEREDSHFSVVESRVGFTKKTHKGPQNKVCLFCLFLFRY